MSLSICRSRSTNECSLGSRFDWFVVRHSVSSGDPEIKVLPQVLARVTSIYMAEALAKYQRKVASNSFDTCTIATYSYQEMQEMLARFDNRVLSFPDVFYNEVHNPK